MEQLLLVVLGVLVTGLLSVATRALVKVEASISKIYSRLEELRVHVAEKYVSKDDLKDHVDIMHK